MQTKTTLKTMLFLTFGLIFLISGFYFSVQIEKAKKANFEKQLAECNSILVISKELIITEYFNFFPLLIIAFGFVFVE